MNKDIIVVAGLGRCGTTLLMRMLHAGGLPVIGNLVAFEDDRCADVQKNNSNWLAEAKGKAVKILDMHRMNLPPQFKYRVIWLERNYEQQAKSIHKFTKLLSKPDLHRNYWKKILPDLKSDTQFAWAKFQKWQVPWMLITFESLLLHDDNVINNIINFTGFDLDKEKMKKVIMLRPTTCEPDLTVEKYFLDMYGKKKTI